MKKIIFTTVLATIAGAFVFAGGVENKTNLSTGYLRNPSRNVESERPEAAFYNIAGTAFMEDGLYVEAGNQFVIKEYSHEMNIPAAGIDMKSTEDTPVLLYPNADIVYKQDKLSIFGNFGIYAGGGNLEYKNTPLIPGKMAAAAQNYATQAQNALAANNAAAAQQYQQAAQQYQSMIASTKTNKLEVSSMTYGGQIGVGYAINDIVSLSAAFRTVYGDQTMKLSLASLSKEISYDASAWGFGGVFGVHVKPIENLDLALQYQSLTKIEYEFENVKGADFASKAGLAIANGEKFNTDLPAVLNFGVGYRVIDPLYLSASFNYYFNKQAEQNSALGETDYDDSFEISVGADYRFNEKVSASLGLSYGNQGQNDESNSPLSPVLDSFTVGAGVEYSPTEALTLTGAGMYVEYFEEEYSSMDLNKDTMLFSLGVTYKFF